MLMSSQAKKILPLVVVLAVVIGVFVGLRMRQREASQEKSELVGAGSVAVSNVSVGAARPSASGQPSITSSSQAVAAVSSVREAPEKPFLVGSADAPPPMDPETVVGNMRIAIINYGSMFKGNPVGTNPEITAALNGGNPKEVKFIKEDSGLRINGRGELVDYWGTPFFFHQISGTEMEIRSAGPDGKMWTADDVVMK